MKKFFITSLAITVAALSQAATVEWTSGNLAQYKTSEIKDPVTAYYYVVGESAYNEAVAALAENGQEGQKAIFDQYYGKDDLKNSKVTPNETVVMNSFGTADWSQPIADDATTYVVAIYKFDSNFGGSYALASAFTYTDETSSLDETELPDISGISGIAESTYNNYGGWVAVPEPTTVALLALGLAAVGLKRKVA